MQALQNKAEEKIPEIVKKRMIQLLVLLDSFSKEKITSREIKNLTGWTDSTIRHDFWLLDLKKGVSNGYFTAELKSELEEKLGLEKKSGGERKRLCIAGLNRLGAALLDENTFSESGFEIKAGFDTNLYRVEILRSSFPLYPASQMDFVIKKEKIEYAVLTVDSKSAQSMAMRLASAGIKGIVNMTDTIITVPENVKVENASITTALKLVI